MTIYLEGNQARSAGKALVALRGTTQATDGYIGFDGSGNPIVSVAGSGGSEFASIATSSGSGVSNGEIDAVAQGYLATTNTAAQNSTGMASAFTACIAGGYGLFVPAGTYSINSGNHWNGLYPQFRGAGNATLFNVADNTNAAFHFGSGSEPARGGQQGYARDFAILGPTARPTSNGTACVLCDCVKYFQLQNINVGKYDIGFDFTNNCFGSYGIMLICKGGDLNVAVNLQTGSVSGSDLKFYNCWAGGDVAGVYMSGGADGYGFYGGQMGCGSSANTAAQIGCMVFGKDYITGATNQGGVGRVTVTDVDFEGWQTAPAFMVYNTSSMSFRGCSFLATMAGGSAQTAASIFSIVADTKISFADCVISGNYANAALGAYTSPTGALQIHEQAWSSVSPFYIDGVSQGTGTDLFDSIAQQSGLGAGTGFTRYDFNAFLTLNAQAISIANNQLRASSNRGSSYTELASPITAVSNLTTQAAAQSGTALLATGSNPQSGMYRIVWSATLTQAATVSSTLGGSTGFQVIYTDVDTNASVTTLAQVDPTATGNTVGLQLSGTVHVNAKTGTAITYSFGYTTSGATAMQYAIHVRCEQMI